MSKIDAKGAINWMHIAPKQQREVIQTGSGSSYGGFSLGTSFFAGGFNWPFYAGFGVLSNKNSINIIFNDHKKNANVLQLGQKVKKISYFGKSDCYAIALDANTGKYTKNSLFSNKDQPTAMPRLGSVLASDLYLIGKDDKILGKSKIAIAKLSLKN
jgi:hypothetical protein